MNIVKIGSSTAALALSLVAFAGPENTQQAQQQAQVASEGQHETDYATFKKSCGSLKNLKDNYNPAFQIAVDSLKNVNCTYSFTYWVQDTTQGDPQELPNTETFSGQTGKSKLFVKAGYTVNPRQSDNPSCPVYKQYSKTIDLGTRDVSCAEVQQFDTLDALCRAEVAGLQAHQQQFNEEISKAAQVETNEPARHFCPTTKVEPKQESPNQAEQVAPKPEAPTQETVGQQQTGKTGKRY